MAKADIDFEKELWDATNELRGAVSENNFSPSNSRRKLNINKEI